MKMHIQLTVVIIIVDVQVLYVLKSIKMMISLQNVTSKSIKM